MNDRSVQTRVDLNVTPLIDVLLAARDLHGGFAARAQGIDTEVPAQTASRPAEARPDQIVLRYEADGQLSVNQQTVALAELPARLHAIYATRHDKTLYIMGSGALRYGAIVGVMDVAKGAGVSRVGVITERMRETARRS